MPSHCNAEGSSNTWNKCEVSWVAVKSFNSTVPAVFKTTLPIPLISMPLCNWYLTSVYTRTLYYWNLAPVSIKNFNLVEFLVLTWKDIVSNLDSTWLSHWLMLNLYFTLSFLQFNAQPNISWSGESTGCTPVPNFRFPNVSSSSSGHCLHFSRHYSARGYLPTFLDF